MVALVDFRYIADALTPDEALAILRGAEPGRRSGSAQLRAEGYPAYTTSPGWLGYSDEKLAPPRAARPWPTACADQAQGRRATSTTTSGGCGSPGKRSARTCRSPSTPTSAGTSTRRSTGWRSWPRSTRTGSRSRPARTTSSATRPSARAVAPVQVATGEHIAQPRDVQAAAPGGAIDVLPDRRLPRRRGQREPGDPAAGGQVRRPGLPARRRGGAVRARAAPVRCSTTSRSAGTTTGRVIEYVDHLHEHFVDPAQVRAAATGAGVPGRGHRDAGRVVPRSTGTRAGPPGAA